MNTKDLIKKMSKSQDVKPTQLTKIVEPEQVKVSTVFLKDMQTAQEAISKEVKKMQREQEMQEAKDDIRKLNESLIERIEELQSALEIALKENHLLNVRLTEMERRFAELDKRVEEVRSKPSFLKRLFKWRS